MNFFCGKFAQKPQNTRTLCIRDPELLQKYAFKDKVLQEIGEFNDDICQITISKSQQNSKNISRKGSSVYTSFINAYARIHLFEAMEELVKNECNIVYIDTDSILFKRKKDFIPETCVKIGQGFGEWKFVHRKIKAFYSLGPKSYSIFTEEGNTVTEIVKISGIAMNQTSTFTMKSYANLVKEYVSDIQSSIKINQLRNVTENNITKKVDRIITLRNVNRKRRFIKELGENSVSSYPYGYKRIKKKQSL